MPTEWHWSNTTEREGAREQRPKRFNPIAVAQIFHQPRFSVEIQTLVDSHFGESSKNGFSAKKLGCQPVFWAYQQKQLAVSQFFGFQPEKLGR